MWFAKRKYPTVPLATALEWIGLDAFPAVGESDRMSVGVHNHKESFLHVETGQDHSLSICVSDIHCREARLFFEGALIYGGKAGLQLQLKRLFILGKDVTAPHHGDVQTFFESVRWGLKEGQVPGVYPNWPAFGASRPQTPQPSPVPEIAPSL